MTTKLLLAMSLMMGLAVANSAFAYTTRSFTLDSTDFYAGAEDNDEDLLVAIGDGNITGNEKNGNIPNGWDVTVDGSRVGYATDMFQVNDLGESSGSFSVLSEEAWEMYSRIAIGLKVGNNNSPDWVVMELENKAKFGNWSTTPVQGGALSHYMIYTMDSSVPPSSVPLPGAFWLLGSGLLGLRFLGRNK